MNFLFQPEKSKTENNSEFSAKDYVKESMQNLSQNFSITGSQPLSPTPEITNITKDAQEVGFISDNLMIR